MYARKYSPINDFEKLSNMIKNILLHFEEMVSQLQWMDSTTKTKAINKLRSVKFIIGHPNEMFNSTVIEQYYATLEINHEAFLESMLQANRFKQRKQFGYLQKSDTHSLAWLEFADTAVSNAFYNANHNTVCNL